MCCCYSKNITDKLKARFSASAGKLNLYKVIKYNHRSIFFPMDYNVEIVESDRTIFFRRGWREREPIYNGIHVFLDFGEAKAFKYEDILNRKVIAVEAIAEDLIGAGEWQFQEYVYDTAVFSKIRIVSFQEQEVA